METGGFHLLSATNLKTKFLNLFWLERIVHNDVILNKYFQTRSVLMPMMLGKVMTYRQTEETEYFFVLKNIGVKEVDHSSFHKFGVGNIYKFKTWHWINKTKGNG
jgi:hypothetical protein